jgi:integrase/recombinase XerD
MWITGVRIVALKISDLFFEEGFIMVTGKGNKQRFVPISVLTQKYINSYRNGIRLHIAIKKGLKILCLNRRGAQLSRAMILQL